jgi:hypothetical protein
MQQTSNRKTSGEVFKNGMIELVADEAHDGQLSLLLWKEGEISISRRVKIDRKMEFGSGTDLQTIIFEPEDLNPTFLQAMRFPSRADPFGSTRQLMDEICEIIKRFTDLGNDNALLAAHSVLASWFLDATDCPVSLVIYGPDCPQGQRLIRILSCLYHRALLVGQINFASLCALPMAFSPSLFIERYDHSPQIQKVIRATRTRGHIPSKGRLVTTRCTTVIYSEEPLNGVIPDSGAIEIPVTHTRDPVPALNENAQRSIADKFQSRLLMYRLVNYMHVLNSTFDAAPLTSTVNDLARSLGACIVDDPAQQANIVRLLGKKDKEVSEDCSWDLSVTVLEAMFSLCHKKKESVYVSEVANEANSILESRGELIVMTPRAVGSKLRVMGLTTGRMGSSGRGMLLTREIQMRIHRLALDNNLQLQRGVKNQCDDCGELIVEQQEREESIVQELADIDLRRIIADHPDRHDPFQ